jgi:hypothetical protein
LVLYENTFWFIDYSFHSILGLISQWNRREASCKVYDLGRQKRKERKSQDIEGRHFQLKIATSMTTCLVSKLKGAEVLAKMLLRFAREMPPKKSR